MAGEGQLRFELAALNERQRDTGVHQNTPFWGNVCGESEPGGAKAALQQVPSPLGTRSHPPEGFTAQVAQHPRVDAEPLRCREEGSAGSEQQPHTAGLR